MPAAIRGLAAMNAPIGTKTSAVWNRRNDAGSTPIDRVGSAVEQDALAEHAGLRAESRLSRGRSSGGRPVRRLACLPSGVNGRPITGATPSIGSTFGAHHLRRASAAGSVPPLRLKVVLRNAPHAWNDCASIAEVAKVLGRERQQRELRRALVDHDDAIGVRERQRPQHDRIHDAENG